MIRTGHLPTRNDGLAIRRRGKKWVADYYDAFGVRRWVTKRTHAEAKDAEAKGRLAAQQTTKPAVSPEVTVSQYAQRWLGVVAAVLKPSTVAGYQQKLELHLLPT